MDIKIVIGVVGVILLILYFRSIIKIVILLFIVLMLTQINFSNLGFLGGGDWTDAFKKTVDKGQVVIKEQLDKMQTQTQTPRIIETPKIIEPPKSDNVCQVGNVIYGKGDTVVWNDGESLNVIPFTACYLGCEYAMPDELAGKFFWVGDRVGRLGDWKSTGVSCCPPGERWVVDAKMCCKQGEMCLRIEGSPR